MESINQSEKGRKMDLQDHISELQRYRDFSPTGFDQDGAFLPDQGDWLVVPVMQTRDSVALEQSNFTAALAMLKGESETVEVHRFGHWGPGWFEIIIVNSESNHAETAAEIACALAEYPILDETDCSEREYEEACAAWDNTSLSERVTICARHGVNVFAARHDSIPQRLPHWEDFYRTC
jgi:hypothetical protein